MDKIYDSEKTQRETALLRAMQITGCDVNNVIAIARELFNYVEYAELPEKLMYRRVDTFVGSGVSGGKGSHPAKGSK